MSKPAALRLAWSRCRCRASAYRTMFTVMAGGLTTLYMDTRPQDDTQLIGGEATLRNALTGAESTRRTFGNNFES
jgi:hypothetical protein